ncbi:MAG: YjiH family protein [Pseudomonadota bacterium]
MTNNKQESSYSAAMLAKFIIPSLVGAALFLTPIEYQGKYTVVLGIWAETIRASLGSTMAYVTTAIFATSAILSLVFSVGPTHWAKTFPKLYSLFNTGSVWLALRVLGGIFSVMTLLQFGPDWVTSKETGVTAFVDVAGIIFCLIGIGCLCLPLLTDYGILEFVGTLLRRVFQRIFGLPGRATIDALASWVGSSSIAVLVTIRQYETGYYTMREASVIATNFSVVSVPFVVLIAQVAGIAQHFFLLYGAMVFIGVLCAIITPRLPPLSSVLDEFYEPAGKQIKEEVEHGHTALRWAFDRGIERAAQAPGLLEMLRRGVSSLIDLFFTMMPAAMTIEFLTLAVYYHTEILQVLTAPLVPILNLLQIPESAAAAPGVMVGLLDQFVPAIIAGGIDNPKTSFVLAGLSVTQLIFFAESAILILRSNIPLGLFQLVTIFCLRTVIALPLLALIAHAFL